MLHPVFVAAALVLPCAFVASLCCNQIRPKKKNGATDFVRTPMQVF